MRARRVYLEVFDKTYIFCLRWKKEDFKKWYRRHYDTNIDTGNAYAITEFHADEDEIIIWTSRANEADLLHECVHAANMTLDAIGHKEDFKNDEVQAYLIDWIFSKAKGAK